MGTSPSGTVDPPLAMDVMYQQVVQLLKCTPGQPYTIKEVGKKVCRQRFSEDPFWAKPVLRMLAAKEVIAQTDSGYYFFPDPDAEKKR